MSEPQQLLGGNNKKIIVTLDIHCKGESKITIGYQSVLIGRQFIKYRRDSKKDQWNTILDTSQPLKWDERLIL